MSESATQQCSRCGNLSDLGVLPSGEIVCEGCLAVVQMEPDPVRPARRREGGPVRQDVAPLVPAEGLPDEEPRAGVTATVPEDSRESREAYIWLQAVCAPAGEAVTFVHMQAYIQRLQDEQAKLVARVTRFGVQPEVRPETVPLEVAAQCLWLHMSPEVQEALTAACELLDLPLNRVILNNLAFSRHELLNQDASMVPPMTLGEQYGQRGGVAPRSQLPGGRRLNGAGVQISACACCGRDFTPARERPGQLFCDGACGEYASQLKSWATNLVDKEYRSPEHVMAPRPEPATYWPAERCTEAHLVHAGVWREGYLEEQMAHTRETRLKMRGLG